jgi:hypothetical protein
LVVGGSRWVKKESRRAWLAGQSDHELPITNTANNYLLSATRFVVECNPLAMTRWVQPSTIVARALSDIA